MGTGRYIARQPDDSVNVSKTHPLAEAGILVSGLVAAFIAVTIVIVYLVEIMVGMISIKTESTWLSRILPDTIGDRYDGHPRESDAQQLLDRLAAEWPDTDYQFKLQIMDDANPNAMALPGGLILLTSGLLEQVESENELAFVLGHELGHFHNRDHLRRVGRLTLLSILYSAVNTSGTVGFNVSELALRGFNREQESDADQFGLQLVYGLYGHVNASWAFFARLEQEEGGILANYLDSHPQAEARIRDIKRIADNNRWSQDGTLTTWATEPDITSP